MMEKMIRLVQFSNLTGRFDSEEVETPTDDVDDIVDLMGEDDKKEEEDKEDDEDDEDKKVKKEVEDTDEEDEDEEKLEEPDEDEEETEEEPTIIHVKRQEILKEFPTLFKKFPYIENAIYRNNQYSEVFPTLEEAKDAKEKAASLETFESHLQDGSISEILTAIKDDNKEAYNRIVDDYLVTLGKVDREAYAHVAGNFVKNAISSMVSESKRSGNEALKSAAAILNQFFFGSTDFEPPKKLAKEKDDSVDKEKKEFYEEQYKVTSNELYESATNQIKAIIDANIDRKGGMSSYVKKNAIRDTLEVVESQIKNDEGFKRSISSLWQNAFKNKFSAESKKAIKSAYLNKAKSLLPEAIKKARRDALKGNEGQRADKDRRGPVTPGRSSSTHKKEEGIKKGESVTDFFLRD